MERYQRLFQLPGNLYVAGSPVVIAAGALTKDTQTDRVFIQIKAKSIVEKAIKAIIVELSGYDVSKNKIEETIRHEYLDLDLKFNGEYGSKVPVYLDNSSVRSFSLKNIKVIFADDNSFEADFSSARAIPAQEELGTVYDDDQVFQFKNLFGEDKKYLPAVHDDLFLCSCGSVNRTELCGSCGKNVSDMMSVNEAELKKDGIYNKAVSELQKGDKEGCTKAITLFESIIDWKDSSAKTDECYARIEELRIAEEEEAEAERKRKAEEARIAAEKEKALYKKALAEVDASNYEKAYSMFIENPDYKDSAEQAGHARGLEIAQLIMEKKYDEAQKLAKEMGALEAYKSGMYTWAEKAIEAKDYDSAYEIYRRFSDSDKINESKYIRAVDFLKSENYDSAYKLYLEIDSYSKSQELYENIIKVHPEMLFKYAEVGDNVIFGKYSNNDSEKEPIKWRVLKKEEDRVLVISEYSLGQQPYDKSASHATWETCSLRKWLNDKFYKSAFSKTEQNYILTSNVTADKNPYHDTDPGKDTMDKVFLLSTTEVEEYFKDDNDRILYDSDSYFRDEEDWWLRTPGEEELEVTVVTDSGHFYSWPLTYGDQGEKQLHELDIRPAMWIDIS